MSKISAIMASIRPGPIVLVLVLCLSGCGFRLAGSTDLPPQLASIYLVTSGFSETQRKALSQRLRAAGASLVEQPDAPAAHLSVNLQVLPDRQLVSSGSSGALVKRISRALDFNLKSADGKLLAPAQTLRQQRDISLNDDNLLSSERERENAIEGLEQALYQQLIRQLTRI